MKATITMPYDERIVTLFASEDKAYNRASYTLKHEEHNLVFHIEASDATALRAVMGAITKVLSAWESTLTHGAAGTRDS